MRPLNTVQRNLCVLFVTCVVIISLFKYKKLVEKSREEEHKNRTTTLVVDHIKSNKKSINLSTTTTDIRFDSHHDNNNNNNNNKRNKRFLYILGLFELTTKWGGGRQQGQSELAAARLAIEHINNLNILPDYNIQLLTNDTKCDPGVGIDTLFHAIYSNRTIMMLLGTSCSNVTESLAHIVPYWNILQVSFGSTSPTLSDRRKFPLFFRTIAPESSHNFAKIEFVKKFHWTTVATFCQSENEYLLPLNDLIKQFENVNITCATTITFTIDNYKEQLKILKDSDVRIIIGSFSAQLAAKVFCEVYQLEMYGSDYVWILQDRHEFWWKSPNYYCTQIELNRAIESVILISDYNAIPANYSTISGLEYDRFTKKLDLTQSNTVAKYASLTYDAIWAIALTLRHTYHPYSIHRLHDFNYHNRDIVGEFIRQMNSLSFVGLSGPIKFIGGDRIGNSLLQQFQNGRLVKIAVYDPIHNRLDFDCSLCQRIVWKNGQIPIDQRILRTITIQIPSIIFYLTIIISIFGIGVSLFLLYFNLHFRRMRTVKMSSPKLNNVAGLGCICVYIYVILYGFHMYTLESKRYFMELCTFRVYLLSSGLSLAFGSMFAKTYRIHRIFICYRSTTLMKDKLLKDNLLIGLILIPLIIDGIIVTLWIMIDPMERKLYNLTLQINQEMPGIVYQPQVEMCASQNTIGWYFAIYGYKAIVLIMGLFMAWETRHIKIQAINDAQYIGICVYSAVFTAIITILSSLTSEYVIFNYLARTFSILISTSLILFLLFLPKLKTAITNRINCHDSLMKSMGLKIEHKTCRFIIDDTKEQLNRLEIQNRVYKCELAKLDLEIDRLEKLLTVDNVNCKIDRKSSHENLQLPIIHHNDDNVSHSLISNNFQRIFHNNAKNNRIDNRIINVKRLSLPTIEPGERCISALIKTKSADILSTYPTTITTLSTL